LTIRSSSGGLNGSIVVSGGGSAVRMAAMRLAWLLPLNTLRPVTIS
jgi:hypothetical protein